MPTTYHVTDIRNVALAGHGASGKTSLADALLFASGATNRKGSVDDGTSNLDIDEEEKRRHFTIDCHLGHLAWTGKQVHLIDTPGYPDFIGNALGHWPPLKTWSWPCRDRPASRSTPAGCFKRRAGWDWAGSSWSPRWMPTTSTIGPTWRPSARRSARSACRSTCPWGRARRFRA